MRGRIWLAALVLVWAGLLVVAGAAVLPALSGSGAGPAPYAEEQARLGIVAYSQHCARCHGPELEGGSAPALVGPAFLAGWEGATVAELHTYVRREMPLGRGGSLDDDTYARATALILSGNGFPAGHEPLAAGSEAAASYRLEPSRASDGPRISPAVADEGPRLLERLFVRDEPAGPESRLVAQTGGGDGGDGGGEANRQNPNASGGAPEGGSGEGSSEGSGQGSGQGSGAPPITPAVRSETAAIRFDVRPRGAAVTVSGPAGERSFDAGTWVLGGLEPGEYVIRAEAEGRALEQSVALRAGDSVPIELALGLDPDDVPEVEIPLGRRVFAEECVACHGPLGGGAFGPALADNPRLDDDRWVADRILGGGLGMPAFAPDLTDEEVAAVIGHVRSLGGDGVGSVPSPELVASVREELAPARREASHAPDLARAGEGEQSYVTLCSACHGVQGGGGEGPPLAGNPFLADERAVVERILFGSGYMPPFALHSDEEIAAVASYVRDSWGNSWGPVSPGQVSVFRPDRVAED